MLVLVLYAAVTACIGLKASESTLTTVQVPYKPLWRYDDELTWPGRSCKHGGLRQSPIDIRTASIVMDYEKRVIKYGRLVFDGYSSVPVDGVNNGHTIQFTTEGDEESHPTLTGGPLKHLYRLEQLHFHWLSEHSVDGLKYPMEIHFVHVRKDLNVSKALREGDGLAILAVFCNVLDSDIEQEFSHMDQVMLQLPKLDKVGSRVRGAVFNMTRLLSSNPQSYVTYEGSLTSPECNEVVTWLVMEKPIVISDIQFRRISATGAGRHNFRRVQPSNRTVYRPVDALNTPLLVQAIGDMLGLLTNFFRNVTRMLVQATEESGES